MASKRDVEAMIYKMSGDILSGQAIEEGIEEVVELAKEHDLLPLIGKEFGSITRMLEH